MAFDWTEKIVRRLHKLWAEGNTASAIGHELGTTKNAVTSKKRRLAKKSAATPKANKKTKAPARPPRPKKVRRKAKPLINLEPGECHFPVNQARVGQDHLFCAKPTLGEKTYCPKHRAVVWRPAPRRIPR